MFRSCWGKVRGAAVAASVAVVKCAHMDTSKEGLYCFPKSDRKEVGKCIPPSAIFIESSRQIRADMLCAFADDDLRIQRYFKTQNHAEPSDVLGRFWDYLVGSSNPKNLYKNDQIRFQNPTFLDVVSVAFPFSKNVSHAARVDAIAKCEVWVAVDRGLTSWKRVGVVGTMEPRADSCGNWRSFDVSVDYPVHGLRITSPIPEVAADLTEIFLYGRPQRAKV